MKWCRLKRLVVFCFLVLPLAACGCGGPCLSIRFQESKPLLIKGRVKKGFLSIGHLNYNQKAQEKQQKELLVDRILAVPIRNGQLSRESIKHGIAVILESSGAFAIKAHKGYDWIFILQNTAADGLDQFKGQIAMPLERSEETLLVLPATKLREKVKEINLGNITLKDKQVVADRKLAASDFMFKPKVLETIAAHDAPLAGIKNFTATSGDAIYHTLRTDFKWISIYQGMDGIYTHPYFTGYQGYNFQLDTNSTAVSMNEICGSGGATKRDVALYPPAGCLVESAGSGPVYSSVSPITNNAVTCSLSPDGAVEVRDDDFFATNRYGDLSFTFGGHLQTDPIPGGLWDYKIDDVIQAQFDPSVVVPKTEDNKVAGLVPCLRANQDAGGRITSFEITWMVRNDAAHGFYDMVSETAVVESLVSGGDIYLENQSAGVRRYESIHYTPVSYTVVSPVNAWYYGHAGPADQQAESIGIHWTSGATGYFIHFPRYVGEVGEVSLILPIPEHERLAVSKGQTFNLAAGHEGLDFGFSDYPAGGYTLHDIVAPCDGVIKEINRHVIPGSGNEAFSIMINYNATWSILLGFEPDTDNTALVDLQADELEISCAQIVHQGEIIGRLVTTESTPGDFGSHVHWGVYEIEPPGSPERPICPHSLCTPEAAAALEALYRDLPGGPVPVCVP